MTLRHADLKIAENELHRSVANLLDWTLLSPAIWTTFPAGWGKLGKATAGSLKGCGLKTGIPDCLIFFDGRCIGIELKTPGGRLSKEQECMFPRLEAAGVPVYIADNVDTVLDILVQENLPMRQLRFTA